MSVLSKLRLQTDEPTESTKKRRMSLVGWKLNWVFWLSIIRVRLTILICLYVRSGWHHKRLFASPLCMTVKSMDDG